MTDSPHDHDGARDRIRAHAAYGARERIKHFISPHSHDSALAVDTELETSARGIRALTYSFIGLALTTVLQAVVVALSGSVALLGDTLHNGADALTAVPLAIAFTLGRRAANRRYTYGYGRAEDLAGIVIVLFIAASAVLAATQAIDRLVHPRDVGYLGLVAAAGFIGFAGNELVAQYRIKIGREIGSAALVADGLHARTDGLTSLAVLFGAGATALEFHRADPIVGLVITVAILVVLRDAAREVYRRIMDAVDPVLLDTVEAVLRDTPGAVGVGAVHLRWIGHSLRAECELIVPNDLSVIAAHQLAEQAEHRLLHEIPRLTSALVHADPVEHDGTDQHELTGHHARRRRE